MNPIRVMDVSRLPSFNISSRSPLWLGQLLMCAIEGTLLLMMAVIYFYLRLGVDVWPPPRVFPLGLTLPTLALIPLAVSCIGSYMASEAAKRDSRQGMLRGLGVNLVLGIVFLLFRAAEWRTFNFTWSSDAHGSIVWGILFLHTFDVIADLIMTAVLIVIVAIGPYGPKQRIGVHVDSVIWYFLAAVWIPLYIVVYWGPHIVGSAR